MGFRTRGMSIAYSIIVLLLWMQCGAAVKECTSDDDCKKDEAEFCPESGPYCIPCLQCHQLNREPSLSCARRKLDCGGCLDGFQEGGTDCVPLPKKTEVVPMNASGPRVTSDQIANAGQSEGTSSWLVILWAVIAVAGFASLATVGYCAYKRRRRPTVRRLYRQGPRGGNEDGADPRSHELDPCSWNDDNDSYSWVAAEYGDFPENAVKGGYSASPTSDTKETLYVARAWHKRNLIPGKLHRSHRCCYVSHCDKEYQALSYEVLVAKPGALEWVASGPGKNKKKAVLGGKSESGELYKIGRCQHGRSLIPGRVYGEYCYYGHAGEEFKSPSYDILVFKR